jgi:hypothetical protein
VRGGIAIVALALAACGAGSGEGLDQSGQPAPSCGTSAGAAPFAPTLDSIQTNVFDVNCAVPGCHGGAAAQQGLRLDAGFSAGNLINVASPRDPNLIRVIPGNPDASFIIQKLEGTQTLGDRMPDGGPYLSQSMIDVICTWIQNGAPTQ